MQHARSPPDKTAFETLNTGATGFIISSTSLRVPLTETAKRRFFPSFNLSIIVAERFTNVNKREELETALLLFIIALESRFSILETRFRNWREC